jgi:hypothetical protein
MIMKQFPLIKPIKVMIYSASGYIMYKDGIWNKNYGCG